MAQAANIDVKQLVLPSGTFGPAEVEQLVLAIAADFSQYRALRVAVAELEAGEEQSPAGYVRLGVCLYLLGRYQKAIDALRKGDGGALAHFYLAKSSFALQEYDAALDAYGAAQKAGYDSDACALGRSELPPPVL